MKYPLSQQTVFTGCKLFAPTLELPSPSLRPWSIYPAAGSPVSPRGQGSSEREGKNYTASQFYPEPLCVRGGWVGVCVCPSRSFDRRRPKPWGATKDFRGNENEQQFGTGKGRPCLPPRLPVLIGLLPVFDCVMGFPSSGRHHEVGSRPPPPLSQATRPRDLWCIAFSPAHLRFDGNSRGSDRRRGPLTVPSSCLL